MANITRVGSGRRPVYDTVCDKKMWQTLLATGVITKHGYAGIWIQENSDKTYSLVIDWYVSAPYVLRYHPEVKVYQTPFFAFHGATSLIKRVETEEARKVLETRIRKYQKELAAL